MRGARRSADANARTEFTALDASSWPYPVSFGGVWRIGISGLRGERLTEPLAEKQRTGMAILGIDRIDPRHVLCSKDG